MTNREYQTRLAYLEMIRTEPDLTHWYLMQIAAEVRRVLSKKPNQIKLEHFKLLFEAPETPEQKGQRSKRTWLQALGILKQNDA